MKALLFTSAVMALAPAAAFAGPYVNIEANSGFAGGDYVGSVIDNHIGIESNGWYVQGGPAIVAPDAGDGELEFSGKAGVSLPLTETADVYGEVSFMTADEDVNYGTKLGVKWAF